MATEKAAPTVKPTKGPAKPPAPRPQAPTRPTGDSSRARLLKYLGEVQTELRKTTWPTKAEVIAQTKVVLALLLAVGTFMYVWDMVLAGIFYGIRALLGIPHAS